MDDFGERPELNGTLISLEFGQGGRIQQLWASDPNLPEDGEEFQFVLAPVNFGEEFAEDYYPGTILLGARTNQNEPWLLSRNTHAEYSESEDMSEPGVMFEYEFSFIPEIRAIGRFYEIPGPIPQIAWDLTLSNTGRRSIEIGELAFPFAFHNLYEGFARSDKTGKDLWHDRVYVHKFIGGAASYLFAQRLTAEPPGLLVFPGDDTSWEFISHVRASLNTPFRWEGIPIVYLHSRAAVEREGWAEGPNGHTSRFLEPGDLRTFQTRFVPADRDKFDNVSQTLSVCAKPAIRLLPSAVAPADVGVAVEIAGSTPTRFYTDKKSDMETDSDEEGGFCFLKPKEPGPLRLSFEDTQGRTSHAHLMFIEPIEKLIRQRAKWILENQVHQDPASALHKGVLVANTKLKRRLSMPEEISGPFAVEGGLADALFLAEKNTIYPERGEIEALDALICEYLRDDLQNPADDTVGSSFADSHSVALNYARPNVYPLVFNLYHSMYRIAKDYGETALQGKQYLAYAAGTAYAMLRHGIPRQARGAGFPGYSRIFEVLSDMAHEHMHDEIERLMPFVSVRAEDQLRREYPSLGEGGWDTAGFEEMFTSARYLSDDGALERAMRAAYAARPLSPSWWWYGTDVRLWDDMEGLPLASMADKGEMCLGHTTAANSMMFFETLDRDYSHLPEAYLRVAFGGMLGVWALVQPDGSGSMAYCPDPASRQFGFSPLTGDIGLSLFHYLRGAGSYVLPSRNYGVFTFGCHFEVDENAYTVRPWDGVGRRVILRQVGAEFETSFGKILDIRLDVRKRWAEVTLENPADKNIHGDLRVRGMWGNTFEVRGERVEAVDGELAVRLPLSAHSVNRLDIKVV